MTGRVALVTGSSHGLGRVSPPGWPATDWRWR